MNIFDDKKYSELLIAEIHKWNGARFKMSAYNPYREIDCGRLVAAILFEIGIFNKLDLPDYTPKCWYMHNSKELILECFLNHVENYTNNNIEFKAFESVKKYKTGDILLLKTFNSRAYNHIGIWNEKLFSADHTGVKYNSLDKYNRIQKILTYRIYKCQQQQ